MRAEYCEATGRVTLNMNTAEFQMLYAITNKEAAKPGTVEATVKDVLRKVAEDMESEQ